MFPFGANVALGSTIPGVSEVDSSTLIQHEALGRCFWIKNTDPALATQSGVKGAMGPYYLKCVLLRNLSGGILLPGRVVAPDTAPEMTDPPTGSNGINFIDAVEGYQTTKGGKCVVVDPYLHATNGVAANDLFLGILEGPVKCRLPANGNWTTNPAVGSRMIAGTDNAIVVEDSIAVATALDQINNLVGHALQAKSTPTDDDGTIWVNCCIRW